VSYISQAEAVSVRNSPQVPAYILEAVQSSLLLLLVAAMTHFLRQEFHMLPTTRIQIGRGGGKL